MFLYGIRFVCSELMRPLVPVREFWTTDPRTGAEPRGGEYVNRIPPPFPFLFDTIKSTRSMQRLLLSV